MKLTKEIDLTPEAEADVALFRKTFPSSRMIFFKVICGEEKWCLADDTCVVGIGTGVDYKIKEELKDYSRISEESWKSISSFHSRIAWIEKQNNMPFMLRLKSGLSLSIAPYIKEDEKVI